MNLNYIIYGASVSGQFMYNYLNSGDNKILAFVDKNIENVNLDSTFKGLKVKQIEDLNQVILDKCDEFIVALGSDLESVKLKELLQGHINCRVTSVHDEKYNFVYQNAMQLNKIMTKSVLAKKGWFTSVEKLECVDFDNKSIPWYTYSSIDFLKKRIKNKVNVFEYGCGNSTIWWSERAQAVYSVEDDQEWHSKVSNKVKGNVTVNLAKSDTDYIHEIKNSGKCFDVICIDGTYRNECASVCLDYLTNDGIIIFDNSDWEHLFSKGINFLKDKGFKQLEFYGMGPINDYEWGTSIFYRKENILGL